MLLIDLFIFILKGALAIKVGGLIVVKGDYINFLLTFSFKKYISY